MAYLFCAGWRMNSQVSALKVGEIMPPIEVAKIDVDNFFGLNRHVDYFVDTDTDVLFDTERHYYVSGKILSIHEVWSYGGEKHLVNTMKAEPVDECSRPNFKFEGHLIEFELVKSQPE